MANEGQVAMQTKSVSSSTVNHPQSTPTLNFLLGRSLDTDDLDEEVTILLRAIKPITVAHDDVIFRVRHGGLRMYYDVLNNAPHSIVTRLTTLSHRNIVAKHLTKPFTFKAEEFEWLLRPLVALSITSSVQSGLQTVDVGGKGWGFDQFATAESQYESLLQYLKRKLLPKDRRLWKAWRDCFPLRPQHKREVVVALMALTRHHAWSKSRFWKGLRADLNLELLQGTLREGMGMEPMKCAQREERWRRIYRWGLENDRSGFGWRILECFDREDLSSEEYGDLVEQTLWSLSRASEGLILPEGPQH